MPGTEAATRPTNTTIATRITVADVFAAVTTAIGDFAAAPVLSMAIASVYTLGGWMLALLLIVLGLPYLVYPLAMGFALIAPFIAVAFYSVARDVHSGHPPTLRRVAAAVWQARRRDVRWMALITAFAFFIWMDIAAMITLSFFGAAALDVAVLVREILSTSDGVLFLIVGHIVGAAIAFLVFSISVISFPMLFDRDVDMITAIASSVSLVRRNPLPMTIWCATIVAAMFAAVATSLILLPFVLPVLGYASWHLYRAATRPI